MKRTAFGIVVLAPLVLWAQFADFSGTWKLDAMESKIRPGAGLAGLIRAGAPQTLHITQAENGTIVIESQINESHSRLYKPGAKTVTPVGPSGSIAMTARWESGTLVSEGSLESAGAPSTAVREVIHLSGDRSILTIAVTADKITSTLVYRKLDSVGSCRTWPTPCKP